LTPFLLITVLGGKCLWTHFSFWKGAIWHCLWTCERKRCRLFQTAVCSTLLPMHNRVQDSLN